MGQALDPCAEMEPVHRGSGGSALVFVQDFQLIDRPYEATVAHLRQDPSALLAQALGAAREEGEHLRAHVAPARWPAVIATEAQVRPAPLRDRGECVLMPFEWEAPRAEGLLPRLDADLEVAPFGLGWTWVTLRARYDPTGNQSANAAEERLLQRMAESTLRAFLGGACATLGSAGTGASPRRP